MMDEQEAPHPTPRPEGTQGHADPVHAGAAARQRPPKPLTPDERRQTRLLWTFVLALTALVVLWQHWPGSGPTPDADPDEASAPRITAADLELAPPPELRLSARVAVAWHQFGEVMPALESSEMRHRRLAEMRRIADDRPLDQLRVAIVAGELRGGEAGLRALDRVAVPEDDRSLQHDLETLRAIYTAALEAREEPDTPAAGHALPIEYETELSEAEQRRLISRHGWFGRLAFSHARPLADEQRARVLSEARQALWTVGGLMLVVSLALLAGLVLLIVAVVLRVKGVLQPAYRRPRRVNLPLLETMAVFLMVMLGGSLVLGAVHRLTGLNLSPVLYLALVAVVFWPLLRGMSWPRLRVAMGWRSGRSAAAEAGWGLLGYVAGMPVLALGFLATVALAGYTDTQPTHPAVETLRAAGIVQVLLTLALAVIWAPVVEESLFRGALYHHIRRGWGPLASGIATGVLFAVVHPQGLVAVPALTAIGFVLAMIREWRGSLIGCISVHAFHNLMTLTIAFLLLR